MSETTTPGQTDKQAWQTPTIEELDYAATEFVYSPGPALIDGFAYTH